MASAERRYGTTALPCITPPSVTLTRATSLKVGGFFQQALYGIRLSLDKPSLLQYNISKKTLV